jgi:hypothetical protein
MPARRLPPSIFDYLQETVSYLLVSLSQRESRVDGILQSRRATGARLLLPDARHPPKNLSSSTILVLFQGFGGLFIANLSSSEDFTYSQSETRGRCERISLWCVSALIKVQVQ